ncbi:hypothetical protein P8V03_06020 [Clostridium sp. A1-XYC3]|uniref:Uncharacterized protein n=1 Tax=Clostridium tanneri TaxID=3037988 RepID=A0ABU4JRY9_9CLOT|nr:hypothetical protein [Clostridium sp. A1-XYC3]MDW8800708.1 hypothetical protein [Clostridium sp. A1-XYC3]
MKNKIIRVLLTCIIVIGLYIGFDIFTHSTIERVIRRDLFFQGYIIKAFKTEISKRAIPDSQYGDMYICRNPAIGPDSYAVDSKYKYFGMLKYWYINPYGSGGG